MEVNQLICPHCNNSLGAAVDAYMYGSPLRQCNRCKNPYLDTRYHEIALEGIRQEDLNPPQVDTAEEKKAGNKAIWTGVGMLAAFVLILFTGWIVFPLPIFGVICIVRGIAARKNAGQDRRGNTMQALVMEKQQSFMRMQNPDYVEQLRAMGYAPILNGNVPAPNQNVTCSRCGTALNDQDRFCPTCGNPR